MAIFCHGCKLESVHLEKIFLYEIRVNGATESILLWLKLLVPLKAMGIKWRAIILRVLVISNLSNAITAAF